MLPAMINPQKAEVGSIERRLRVSYWSRHSAICEARGPRLKIPREPRSFFANPELSWLWLQRRRDRVCPVSRCSTAMHGCSTTHESPRSSWPGR